MADKRAERIAELIRPLRVKPGSKVNLARDFDPAYKADLVKKKDGRQLLETGIGLLADYQRRLAAQDTYGVLMCLQALDAGGKDGTIRHVMSGVNPQGVQVSGFKVPSAEELDHDYLWRYACRLPARGDIGIFNRSHYEEVLVVRVHPENLDREKLPAGAKGKGVWERRYREINDWERYLTDNGFKVVKLFLNLSKEEQRIRFFKRLDLPERNWKFSAADARLPGTGAGLRRAGVSRERRGRPYSRWAGTGTRRERRYSPRPLAWASGRVVADTPGASRPWMTKLRASRFGSS